MSRVKPAEERIAQWDLKFDPERIKAITSQGKPRYLQNTSSQFTDLVTMEVAVKQVLNTEGVSVSDVPDYLCFGREMWSKCKKYSGDTLAKEVAVLITKWVGRGLNLAVLEAIRTQVFNVGPPGGP